MPRTPPSIRAIPVADTHTAGRGDASGIPRWIPLAGFGLLLVALTRQAGLGLSDPDAPWHVVAGRELASTWQFAGPDPLSAFGHRPWILTQWLPELLMAGGYRLGGLPAVTWLASAGITALCAVVYFQARRWGGPLGSVVATGMAALGAAGSLSPRPQVVGMILFVVTSGAWLATSRDHRARWWLLPVAWLWACCHGTWVMGPMVGFVVVAGLVAHRSVSRPQLVRLLGLVLGCAVAGLVTPLGWRSVESIQAVQAVSPYIQEWRHTSLTDPAALVTLLMALVVVLTARRTTAPPWVTAGLVVFALVWTLWHGRTVAFGALLLAPLVAESFSVLIGRPRLAVDRTERLVIGATVAFALTVAGLLAASGPPGMVDVPHQADRALDSLPAGSTVFNTDRLGGWLMLDHPTVRQTFDTRVEVYGPDAIQDYFTVMDARAGWQRLFDELDPDAALVADSAPLARALQDQRGWAVTARGAGYLLLQPSTG
jgi:hypothetical protein